MVAAAAAVVLVVAAVVAGGYDHGEVLSNVCILYYSLPLIKA